MVFASHGKWRSQKDRVAGGRGNLNLSEDHQTCFGIHHVATQQHGTAWNLTKWRLAREIFVVQKDVIFLSQRTSDTRIPRVVRVSVSPISLLSRWRSFLDAKQHRRKRRGAHPQPQPLCKMWRCHRFLSSSSDFFWHLFHGCSCERARGATANGAWDALHGASGYFFLDLDPSQNLELPFFHPAATMGSDATLVSTSATALVCVATSLWRNSQPIVTERHDMGHWLITVKQSKWATRTDSPSTGTPSDRFTKLQWEERCAHSDIVTVLPQED